MRGSLPVLPRPLVKGIPGAVTNFIFLFVIFLFFFFFFAGIYPLYIKAVL